MAFDLNASIVAGNVYNVSFYAEWLTSFGSAQPFEIGVSNSITSFGTLVFSGTPGDSWTLLSGVFVAPFTATYLTARPRQGLDTWIAVDNFQLTLCAAGSASSETSRAGSPPNANALLPGQTSGPIIGSTWDPVIDHTTFVPTATIDAIVVSALATNLPSPLGTILCDLTVSIFFPSGAGVPFAVPIPVNCSFVAVPLCTQGVSLSALGNISLTNALDIKIGTF